MKVKIIAVLTMVMIFGASSVIAAGNLVDGSKRLTLKPGASGYTEVEWTYVKRIRIRAKANQGNVAIKVLDPNGKTVARGTNSVSFKSGKAKGKYKIVATNKTKKNQKVELSWIIIESMGR